MPKKVTAVFDIGKTNKKFFLFDEEFNEVDRQYIRFEEIPDDDGFLGEDLPSLVKWMKNTLEEALSDTRFQIKALNFSTYGASFVHLDENNNVVAPFYNYLKPFPDHLTKKFFDENQEIKQFEIDTASPFMGLLNSGLQLYYLKYEKPELFAKIKHSLHFPQYLSYLFTGKYATDYTSLGCHTGMWEAKNNSYSQWIKKEGFEALLAPIVSSKEVTLIQTRNIDLRVGLGIHDSSSALIPYINTTDEPFVLISTGTWSICMNFFNEDPLTEAELNADCLNFLGITGSSIKSSRLFLGKHLSNTAKILSDYFEVDYQTYKSVNWKTGFVSKNKERKSLLFDHNILKPERFGFQNKGNPDYSIFDDYEDALFHLMDELTDLQIESLKLSIGTSKVRTLYIDGGFSSSEVFVQFLANKLPDYKIYSTSFSLGTALGAALLVNYRKLPENFLKNNYKVRRHEISA